MQRKKYFFFIFVIITFILMTYQSKKGRLLHIDFINSILDSSFEITEDLIDAVTKPFKTMMLRDEENRLLQQQVRKLLMEKERGPGSPDRKQKTAGAAETQGKQKELYCIGQGHRKRH